MSIRAFYSEQSGASRNVAIGAAVGLAVVAAFAYGWWSQQARDAQDALATDAGAPVEEPVQAQESADNTPVAPVVAPQPVEPEQTAPGDEVDQAQTTTDPQEERVESSEAPEVSEPAPERSADAPEAVASALDTTPQSSDAVAETDNAPLEEEPQTPTLVAPADEEVAPIFEVVRVEESGDAVIAGRAEAGGMVRILLDGVSVAETSADASGAFVALVSLDPSEDPRTLTLESVREGEAPVVSEQTALVAPFGAVDTEENVEIAALETPSAPVEPSTAEDQPAAGEQAAPIATEAPTVAETPDAPVPVQDTQTAALPGPDATPQVVIVAPDGAVPQSPSVAPARPDAPDTPNVVIDTISYDEEGEVILVGRAQPGNFIRLYLDNILAQTETVAATGEWRSRVTGIEAGVYTLRADETGENGRVVSRFETPFERVTRPRAIAAATQVAEAEVGSDETDVLGNESPMRAAAGIVTVQPGFTLWAIARENYGDGVQYVRVFEANKAQIRDPDLIYPGQVFSVPQQ
ncbi:MAG: LysM peptidoglycan-binding domain-containing protein [Pseudomonadota bacterium]